MIQKISVHNPLYKRHIKKVLDELIEAVNSLEKRIEKLEEPQKPTIHR